MKITLPIQLRRALLALCLLGVSPAFSEEVVRTEINNNTTANDILFNGTAENVTMNFTGDGTDYFPASSPTSYDDILVLSWINGDGHGGSRTYTFEGKVHGAGNIVGWNKGSGDGNQTYVFNGDMSEFTGNITSGVRGLSLKFGGNARASLSGQGALSITHLNKAITYQAAVGDSTITNSSITTTNLNFNGGAGVNYAVSSGISATNLLNIAAGTSVSFSSTVTANALTVGAGSVLNVQTGGSLTINGMVSLFTSINNAGTVTFGNDATVDLTNLAFTQTDQTSTYTLVQGGTIDFGDLDWTSFSGIAGLTATSHEILIDNTAGTVSFTLLAKQLSFTGSADVASPTDLQWSVGGDTVFTEAGSNVAFIDGSSVTFTGHTAATLTEDINVHQLTVAEDASLSIDEAGFAFSAASIVLENNTHLILNTTLVSGLVNFDSITGNDSTTMTLRASAEGTELSLAGFSGTLNLNEGVASSSLEDFNSLSAVNLGDSVSYSIDGTLASGSVDLSKINGEAYSILGIVATGNLSDGGGNDPSKTNLTLSANFLGSLEIAGGLVSVNWSNLGGTASIIMNNGGIVGDHVSGTHVFDKDIQITSDSTGYGRVYSGGRVLELSGAISGDSSTTLAKTDGGTLALSGDMSGFEGSIAVRGGKILASSDIENAKSLFLSSGTSFEVGGGVIVSALGNYNTVTGSYDTYQRRTAYNYTITIGVGAELSDNVHIRQASGELTVNGGGIYNIESYVGGDLTGASTLTIAADTTLVVQGTAESYAVANTAASFALTHNNNGTVDVNGALILNSGISSQDATGIINVNAGGTMELREGLYAQVKNGSVNINVADTATLKLANQENESLSNINGAYNIATNIAGGANIVAMSEETNILNTLKLSGTKNVNVTAEAANASVNFQDVISNTDGATSGLAISGTATQTFTLSAANTYAGDTTITLTNVVAGNAAAFGNGGTVTLNSGSLDLGGHAVANSVVAAGGSLSGFDGFAGNLQVTGAVGISGTTTGSMSVTATGSFTMAGTWDYSSAINIAAGGSLSFDSALQLDLTGIDFTQSGNEYSLSLFTGSGTADIDSWLSAGAVDLGKITGLDSSITGLTYSGGTLSYTVAGDIHITDTNQSLSGQTNVDIIFDAGSTGRAELGTGFTQGPDSSFSGMGTIGIAAGENVTLANSSADFSGTTSIAGILTINNDAALGTSAVEAAAGSALNVSGGVTMSNDATLAENAAVNVGVLTVTGQAGGGSIEGVNKKLSHDSATSSSITDATLTNAQVALTAGGVGNISNSTLTSTYVQLGDGSTLNLNNVHQGLGTTLNNSATVVLTNHTIDENVGNGVLTPVEMTSGSALELVHVYSLTSLNASTIVINDSLTLNIVITDGDDFITSLGMGAVLFEISGFSLEAGSLDEFNLAYSDVKINVFDGSLTGTSLYTGSTLGYTTLANGNMALLIPEPSTASLSLLALAGLLARRRRKQG